MRINRFINATPGGTHGWFEAEHQGTIFRVRKPFGMVDIYTPRDPAITAELGKVSLWARIKNWFKKLFT